MAKNKVGLIYEPETEADLIHNINCHFRNVQRWLDEPANYSLAAHYVTLLDSAIKRLNYNIKNV